jgi:hypothetical protein
LQFSEEFVPGLDAPGVKDHARGSQFFADEFGVLHNIFDDEYVEILLHVREQRPRRSLLPATAGFLTMARGSNSRRLRGLANCSREVSNQ